MSNPLDDYMEMRKEATFWDAVRGFGAGLTQLGKQQLPRGAQNIASAARGYGLGHEAQKGIAAAAGGALLGAGAMAVKKIHNAVTKQRDFKQMMASDPELAGLQKERPKFFNQAYSSLRNVNPTFGKDPIVAGSYMRKMMANPDAAGLTIAQSIKAPQAERGVSLGFEAKAGPFSLKF